MSKVKLSPRALRESTVAGQQQLPLDWATAQNNGGNALRTLERPLQATVAHRHAIAVWQQSDVPEGWGAWAQGRVNEIEALIASRTAKR